ncbi:hypothetical protein [Paenibacillus sp. TSA_86.1]|uniref:hypothetical protein n=1 Tax=Paenibacillus sp. TSA_86.1 TaxID=3415649 RepID=UPI0040461296
MFNKIKYVAATLVVALGLGVVAPSLTYAANPQDRVQTQFPQPTIVEEPANDRVEAMGLKKTALVKALRYGGEALDTVLDWLGVASKEAKYLSKHSSKIADFLDSVTDEIEKKLIDFLIFQCDIPQGYARVIAYAITGFIL